MADFDLGGLLFGDQPSTGLEAYLDPEQLRRMQQQGAMQAAMALLKASGPSRTPVGFGQALGEAYGAGQAGYQQAQQQGIASLMTKQKMEDAERARKMQENYTKMVLGLTGGEAPSAGGNLSPQMALLLSQLPASAGIPELMKYMQPPKTVGEPFRAADGQTYIRTESGGVMPFSIGLAPKTVGEPFKGADGQTYIRTDSGGVMPFSVGIAPKTVGEPFKGADGQTYIRTESGGVMPFATGLAIKPVGAPHPVINAAGKAVLMQSYDDGTQKEISGLSPYEAVSPDIRAVEYLGGKPLAGTGQAGIGLVGEYRRTLAPRTDVKVNTGEKVRAGEINKDIVAQMGDFTSQARSANDTLMNVDRMLPALQGAITGPLADSRTTLIRVGQQLGVVGKDANDVLAKTQILVQGLAQQELSAAGQMKGQGAITAPERELLRRAAVGDQSLSATELKTALETAQKVARYRIAQHQEYLSKFSALPGSEQYVPFYSVTPYQPAGGANPMQTGIDAELAKRAQQQRGGGMR